MRTDYLQLMQEESLDLADFLSGLPESGWDTPSLCAGWRVRDVVAHMAVGHTMPVPRFGLALARHAFRIDATAARLAVQFAETHSTDEVLATFRVGTAGAPRAAARLVPTWELFTDHLVHHQDIRRPLGRPRGIPADRLVAALGTLRWLTPRVGSRRRLSGLRVVATDVDFRGSGGSSAVEIRGPAEALILAACGRRDALPQLSGPGTALLARRLGAGLTGIGLSATAPGAATGFGPTSAGATG